MAFQHHFMQEWKPIPASEKTSACFDCNICLDLACDPVITLCGHLYCWPCIYTWFHSQSASLPSGQLPHCPVCKAETYEKTMVPLYGRGRFPEPEHEGIYIPPRPSACGIEGLTNLFNPDWQLRHYDSYQNPRNYPNSYNDYVGDSEPPLSDLPSIAPMTLYHPVLGMLGEMVCGRVFGSSASLYNSRISTPRVRRQELQADKSLNRISIFLFCCFLLCLFVF